jgi:hypothetical protein
MKNLQDYNVVEMNSNECQSMNGGWFLRAVAGLVFWHWDNWDDIKEGFNSAQ